LGRELLLCAKQQRGIEGKSADSNSTWGSREVMLARRDKAMFWFTLNFAMVDFYTTMLLCIVVIGVGLGLLVSLAGSDRPAGTPGGVLRSDAVSDGSGEFDKGTPEVDGIFLPGAKCISAFPRALLM
jgi:hypothetical protein